MKYLIASLTVLIIWYYVLLIAQLSGIIEITDNEISNINWKHFIPFYQFYLIFKSKENGQNS